jgi:hypothetical protein
MKGALKVSQSLPAVVVVNNPTQLLFAIEAADAFSHSVQELHVVTVPTQGAREEGLYENLFRAAGIEDIDRLGVDSLSRIGRIRDAIRLRRATDPTSRVITPMINYFPARALINRAGQNAVITDDGSWTLFFANRRHAGESQYRTPLHAALPFGRLPRALNFFSIYDEMRPGQFDSVTPNQLGWAKKTFFQHKPGDHLVLLGSDLARAGYITNKSLRRHVARMRERFPGKAEYWPHRREDYGVAQALCQRFDMHLRERSLPFEAEILAVDPSPAVIATLPSTVTRTLRLLKDTVGFRIVVAMPSADEIAPQQAKLFEAVSRSASSDADELL